MAHLCRVSKAAKNDIVLLAQEAPKRVDAHALAWITSESFRKTNATILDEACLRARQVADHLGHARPSLTIDVYMGRGAKGGAAAAELQGAVGTDASEQEWGFRGQQKSPAAWAGLLTCISGAPPGTRTPNPVIKSHLLCQLS